MNFTAKHNILFFLELLSQKKITDHLEWRKTQNQKKKKKKNNIKLSITDLVIIYSQLRTPGLDIFLFDNTGQV